MLRIGTAVATAELEELIPSSHFLAPAYYSMMMRRKEFRAQIGANFDIWQESGQIESLYLVVQRRASAA